MIAGYPPASGKSTLAAALARRSGWPLLSSDNVRKEQRGLPLDAVAPDADYTLGARSEIYRELGELGPDVAARLAADFTAWDEIPADSILTLRTQVDTERLVDQAADWLDSGASVVCPATARLRTDDASRKRT